MKNEKIKLSLDTSLLFMHLLILPIIFDSVFVQYQWYKPFTYGVIVICSVVVLFLISRLKTHLSSKHFSYLCQNFGINLFIAISLIVLEYIGENRTIIVIGLAAICFGLLIYSLVLDFRLNKVFSN